MKRSIVINTAPLLRQPGQAKHVQVHIAPVDAAIDDPRLTGDIEVDLTAASTLDAIRLTGTVGVPWRTECRRCAVVVEGTSNAQVDELYQRHPTEDDAFPIEDDQIDIGPIVRQYALLELPDGVLCRDDCKGLCADCGADLNDGECECTHDDIDPRWAALANLQLDGDVDSDGRPAGDD